MIKQILLLLRLSHWLKNGLIFAALFFSLTFSVNAFEQATATFVGFCFLASSLYILNDLFDVKRDRHHPIKKYRPLAHGTIKPAEAIIILVVLFVLSQMILWRVGFGVGYIGLIYFGLNVFYSLGLKHLPIIDVMIISMGFFLRVIVGAVAIGVLISHWLALSMFFLSLFLAFGKRKNEMDILSLEGQKQHRQSLQEYTEGFISQMLALSAGIAVVFYSLYTIDPATVEHFKGDNLIYTTPIVVYGVLRYFYLLYNRALGGDPVDLVFKDKSLLLTIGLWCITVWLIYRFPGGGWIYE